MSRARVFQNRRRAARAPRRGLVLIMVLIVVVMLSLGAYTFTELMLAHQEAAQLAGRQIQTRALVDSGVEAVKLFLLQPPADQLEAGGTFNNLDRFRAITVIDDPDPNLRGSFSVLSPNLDDAGNLAGVRYGLEDESTRLNLSTLLMAEKTSPTAAQTLLMALPGMTEDVADAILDWLDEDDEPREMGAEVDYYSGLAPPYAPKNGPLETVEELLLVRGVTPQLLFGADVNRNGMIDANEMGGQSSSGSELSAGWSTYLTLFSLERNVRADGTPRIYLNDTNVQTLYTNLSAAMNAEWATYIIAYRQNGPYTTVITSNTTPTQTAASLQLDMSKQARFPISQVLDLIGSNVQYTPTGASTSLIITSPFKQDVGSMVAYMPILMDAVTVNPATTIPGRVNINQASATILAGIPGMTSDIVDQILSRRQVEPSSDNPGRRSETWLLSEGVCTLTEMRALMPFVCGGGSVYRAQVVGYYQGGQAAARGEVIFDASTAAPRVLFWRDVSHLGRGYALETLGVEFSETPQ
jgi:type II secretory pathway component PulK